MLLCTTQSAFVNYVSQSYVQTAQTDCMVFNAVFQQYFIYIAAARALIHAFQEFFTPLLRTMFFPSHWLLSNITIVETTLSGEGRRYPVAITIINPRKKYWLSRESNQRPPVLKSTTPPTELWGSATDGTEPILVKLYKLRQF